MGKKIIVMWTCCRCQSQWNVSTTPACLECGHQHGSCDRRERHAGAASGHSYRSFATTSLPPIKGTGPGAVSHGRPHSTAEPTPSRAHHSILFSLDQVEDVISGFSTVVISHIHLDGHVRHDFHDSLDRALWKHVLDGLLTAVDDFTRATVAYYPESLYPVDTRVIRRIKASRLEIAHRLLNDITGKSASDERAEPDVQSSDNLPSPQTGSTDGPEVLALPMNLLSISADAPLESAGVVEDHVFNGLISEIQGLLERYDDRKMDCIRQTTSLVLRRPEICPDSSGLYRVDFRLACDIPGFLKLNYGTQVEHSIGKVAAVTGTESTPILCSVGDYLTSQWPESSSMVLDAIAVSCGQTQGHTSWMRRKYARNSGSVLFMNYDPGMEQICIATGTKECIIAIAQQISWLTAAFHRPYYYENIGKLDKLSCAYVGFGEVEVEGHSLAQAAFRVDVKLHPAIGESSQSCWKALLGPAVIISGFPVPPRDVAERGLEISVPEMAAMARIPHAVSFDGGFIFKGRCHALVPIRRVGDSIQWHMLDTYPEKLDWDRIRSQCPSRLKGHIKKFVKRRSFVGWCPEVLDYIGKSVGNLGSPSGHDMPIRTLVEGFVYLVASDHKAPIGTTAFNFGAVGRSRASNPRKWLEIDKLTFGFSHWGAFNFGIIVGQLDGYRPEKPSDYSALLEYAKDIPVILFDTTQWRAIQTNGEEMILQILLHRKSLEMNGSPSRHHAVDFEPDTIDGATPNRKWTSTRQAMELNAERVMYRRTSLEKRGAQEVLFKDEVKRIYGMLDRLQEITSPCSTGTKKVRIPLGRHRIDGWEYMSLVTDTTPSGLPPRSVGLGRSHGGWYRYARDTRTLFLFASNLMDSFPPANPTSLCTACLDLPRGDCALTIRASTLASQLKQHQSDHYPSRITDNDWTLQSTEDPFTSCEKDCRGLRVVTLAKRPASNEPHFPHNLPLRGAVVIGNVQVLGKFMGSGHQNPFSPGKGLRNGRYPLQIAPQGIQRLVQPIRVGRTPEDCRARFGRYSTADTVPAHSVLSDYATELDDIQLVPCPQVPFTKAHESSIGSCVTVIAPQIACRIAENPLLSNDDGKQKTAPTETGGLNQKIHCSKRVADSLPSPMQELRNGSDHHRDHIFIPYLDVDYQAPDPKRLRRKSPFSRLTGKNCQDAAKELSLVPEVRPSDIRPVTNQQVINFEMTGFSSDEDCPAST